MKLCNFTFTIISSLPCLHASLWYAIPTSFFLQFNYFKSCFCTFLLRPKAKKNVSLKCTCNHNSRTWSSMTVYVPRPLPDFISQPWRKIGLRDKIWEWPGYEAKSNSGSKHVNCNIAAGVESDEGLTILRTRFRALCEADFLLFDHMTIDQHRKLPTGHKRWLTIFKLRFVV